MRTRITKTPLVLDKSGYEEELPNLRLVTLSVSFAVALLGIFTILLLNDLSESHNIMKVIVLAPAVLTIGGVSVFVHAARLNDKESTASIEAFNKWSETLYADDLARIVKWVEDETSYIISVDSAGLLLNGSKVVFNNGNKMKLIKTEDDSLHLFSVGK